jgi:di/tricarboxylate transporter
MIDLYITIAIIAIAIFLFVKEYFSIDTTSILIMAFFIVSGVLTPEEGFAGFNHPATITLGCMFVVSAAVFKSGIVDGLSNRIMRVAKTNYIVALIVLCLFAAVFSAFVNDSAVVAILIPLTLAICKETGISPSRLMIPISFSALFGGTCTLIGTSTNILVSSYAGKSGLEPFGMFEFSLPALCLLGIGLVYIIVFSPLILPNRKMQPEEFMTHAEMYTADVRVREGNRDIGYTLERSRLVRTYGAQILALVRNGTSIHPLDSQTKLAEQDTLKLLIEPGKLAELRNVRGYVVLGDKPLEGSENHLRKVFEMMVPAGSPLAGSSLRQINFRNSYRCTVIAIRHREETISENISEVRIKEGDMLLVYGTHVNIDRIVSQKLLVLLSEHSEKKVNYRRAIPALLIGIGVVMAAALNITSILISGMVGCLLLVMTTLLKPKEAYASIEWKVIFMMAGVLSMGKALEKTGGAGMISQFVFENMGSLDPRITLSLIFLITFLSTNVLSSKATAALMAPIVIHLAQTMSLSERPFLIAVMFACSLTFMTPVSYPTNTMVYGPGKYMFKDYVKFGTPLNIIIWIAASLIIPLFFPFEIQ